MPTEQQNNPQAITPEIVKKVTDRVYALLLADLKRQRERSRRIKPARSWKR